MVCWWDEFYLCFDDGDVYVCVNLFNELVSVELMLGDVCVSLVFNDWVIGQISVCDIEIVMGDFVVCDDELLLLCGVIESMLVDVVVDNLQVNIQVIEVLVVFDVLVECLFIWFGYGEQFDFLVLCLMLDSVVVVLLQVVSIDVDVDDLVGMLGDLGIIDGEDEVLVIGCWGCGGVGLGVIES